MASSTAETEAFATLWNELGLGKTELAFSATITPASPSGTDIMMMTG